VEDSTVGDRLYRLFASARERWPDVDLPAQDFFAYLRERIPATLPPAEALSELRATDLYFACACARGNSAALSRFEREIVPSLAAGLVRMRLPPSVGEEALQRLRQWLFVSEPGKRLGIEDYAGRGELRAWLRVSAARMATQLVREQRRTLPLHDHIADHLVAREPSPELDLIQQLYRPEVKSAFEDAMRMLRSREQNLLRQHFIDGLTIDDLGKLYGVHRATAARWLARSRSALLRGVRRALRGRIKATLSECDSILRLVRSDLELSVRRIFSKDQPLRK